MNIITSSVVKKFIHIVSLHVICTSIIFSAQGPKSYLPAVTTYKAPGKKFRCHSINQNDKPIDLLINKINTSREITPQFVTLSYDDDLYFGGLEYLNYTDHDNRLNKINMIYDDSLLEKASAVTTVYDILQLLKREGAITKVPKIIDQETNSALADFSITMRHVADIVENGDIDRYITNKKTKKAIIAKEQALLKSSKNIEMLVSQFLNTNT
jgi:hypothetical protein